MKSIKLIIAEPGLSRPEVYRWYLEKPWHAIRIEDCERKLRELTNGQFPNFKLQWYDGHDLCTIQTENDLTAAFNFHKDRDDPKTCMRIYAAPDSHQHSSFNLSDFERSSSSQLLYDYAENEKKRRTRLVESNYQKQRFQKHYLWN